MSIKKRWLFLGAFICLLIAAYFLARKDREKDFVFLVNGTPHHLVYSFGEQAIGSVTTANIIIHQKEHQPFSVKESELALDPDIQLLSQSPLNTTANTFQVTLIYRPSRPIVEKTEWNITLSDGRKLLLDITGKGRVSEWRFEKLQIGKYPTAVSWLNQQIYVSQPTQSLFGMPLHVEAEKSIRLRWNNEQTISALSNVSETEGATQHYRVVTSPLPLVVLDSPDILSDLEKSSGYMSVIESDRWVLDHQSVAIRVRGDTSKAYLKKPYKINILNQKRRKKLREKDVALLGMRKDGDWILNPAYVDRSLIRDKVATQLFQEMVDYWYRDGELTQLKQSPPNLTIASRYVEVIRNHRYDGIYLLTERIDRKKIKLKPDGFLLKRRSTDDDNEWLIFDEEYHHEDSVHYDGHFPIWPPDPNFNKTLAGFFKQFEQAIAQKDTETLQRLFNYPLTALFHCWSLASGARDNGHKNYFLARKSEAEGAFFIPWDSDVSLGRDPFFIPSEPGVMPSLNPLIRQLWDTDPYYRKTVRDMWVSLRRSVLSVQHMISLIDTVYEPINHPDLIRRNFEATPYENETTDQKVDSHYSDVAYMKSWVDRHLVKMDGYLGKQ